MKREIKDGWHVIAGYDVFTENGLIKRGVTSDGLNTIYPYRYNKDYECWVIEHSISIPAFYAGLKRGTVKMF